MFQCPTAPRRSSNPGTSSPGNTASSACSGRGAWAWSSRPTHLELGERVAIKFLLEAPADDAEVAERFLREARAAVRLKSEHVARVIDVGALPSGAPYMVMEYLEGDDLVEACCSRRRRSRSRTPSTTCSRPARPSPRRTPPGIVHRDLKPANLFLTARRRRLAR